MASQKNQDVNNFQPKDVVYLDRGDGSSALVHLHGSTLLSWKCNGVEQIYLSSTAVFDNKKAIRGGVPVVFPNFGPWSLGPQHGFARIKRWSVASPPSKDDKGDVQASLQLEDDEEAQAMWGFKFRLVYTLSLQSDRLVSKFVVHNRDTKSFGFTCLMHTYFRVSDIHSTTVKGLRGLVFSDKLKDGKEETEVNEDLKIKENYDRVYKDAPQQLTISSGPEPARKLELETFNFPDIVLWNPWEEKAKAMGDLDDAGYKEFVCLEAGKVSEQVNLPAGKEMEFRQTFKSLL